MFEFDSFRGVTHRSLRINYISPAVCELITSSSGSSGSDSSVLDILPIARLPGPTNLVVSVSAEGIVTLTWTEQSYIFAYVVYAGPTADGPFTMVTSNVIDDNFSYAPGAGNYFYKVTGIEPDFGETFPSETVGPVVV